MKRKFLTLILCFTIVFSSINFTYAYNDHELESLSLGGITVAPEIIATIGSIAVASGIVLNSTDDIYDITRLVYDNIKEQNKNIATVFQSSVVLLSSGAVKVGKDFLDICKSAFDTSFSSTTKEDVVTNVTYLKGIPVISDLSANISKFANVCFISDNDFTLCGYSFKYLKTDTINMTTRHYFDIYYPSGELYKSNLGIRTANNYIYRYFIKPISSGYQYMISYGYPNSSGSYNYSNVTSLPYVTANDYGYVIPFAPGSYTWDNLNDKLNDDESVDIYVPGNADALLGLPSGGTLSNPSYDLPLGGTVTLPGVNNPSLDVGDNIVIPGIDVDVPDVDVPDTDVPDTILPAFPSFGDSLDFSPMYLTNVTEKFPFSLPWDIGRLIQKFDVEPKAPVFDVPIVSETITLDLTEFSELAAIVRFFVLIGFILSLIFISTKLMA